MSERERVYMDVSFAIAMIGIIYVAVDKWDRCSMP